MLFVVWRTGCCCCLAADLFRVVVVPARQKKVARPVPAIHRVRPEEEPDAASVRAHGLLWERVWDSPLAHTVGHDGRRSKDV